MKLRQYQPDDFQGLWELDQRCFPPEIAYSRNELAYYLRSKTSICLIGEEQNQMAGFAIGHVDRRGFGHVITLDIDPKLQRSGMGTLLMNELEERFRAAQCKSVFLEVAVNNRAALAFYKKHGYSVLKTLRRYYPGDLDGLMMGKRIGDGALQRSEKRMS